MSLPPAPSWDALAALRASRYYLAVVVALATEQPPQAAMEAALVDAAAAGNAPAVLALLELGVPPSGQALEAALASQEAMGPHGARLLFDAGARLVGLH